MYLHTEKPQLTRGEQECWPGIKPGAGYGLRWLYAVFVQLLTGLELVLPPLPTPCQPQILQRPHLVIKISVHKFQLCNLREKITDSDETYISNRITVFGITRVTS